MNNSQIPFDAIWEVAKYVHEDEFDDYCDRLRRGDAGAENHIYLYALTLLKFLASVRSHRRYARPYLNEALWDIEDVKTESTDPRKTPGSAWTLPNSE